MLKENSIKRAQVWIETVIYTLIGLTVIAILLTAALPQIERIRDREVVKQTIIAMNVLNEKVLDAEEYVGSIRIVDFKIAKGRLEISPEDNQIRYVLENTRLKLTEVGEKVKEGDITLETVKYGDRFNVILTLDYNSTADITNNQETKIRALQAGTAPYKIQIENMMYDEASQKVNIDFDIIS